MKIKKGDTVVVISGKDKGKEGTVSRVMPTTNQIIVDGINVVKKHQKPSGTNQQGGIIDRDMPLNASSVMLLHKGKPALVTRFWPMARKCASLARQVRKFHEHYYVAPFKGEVSERDS